MIWTSVDPGAPVRVVPGLRIPHLPGVRLDHPYDSGGRTRLGSGSGPARVRAQAVGIGSGRFSRAAAMISGNRSGVQAKAGTPSAASAAAWSRS